MILDINESLDWIESRITPSSPVEKVGKVVQITGLVIESIGPEVPLGGVVEIIRKRDSESFPAEVVGFRDNRVLSMPLGPISDISVGSRVVVSKAAGTFPVGRSLVGRVIDGLGNPLDGKGPLRAEYVSDIGAQFENPMSRKPIKAVFQTGVKAIDVFAPMGCGQRMGIFAGSGVGKSSLLGMIARGASSDVNVIALVGERGRELREFIESELGEEGLARSVIVVSTSDQPAPLRIRAALLASRIAEYFRDEGKDVLMLMDSVTRFAMAQREIGLAVGEPPATRGYTPSVFSLLPRLIERAGSFEKGSITAIYTVLVEGDDMDEPIADAVRSLLDGHVVLSRDLMSINHFPAVDVLESVSRLVRHVCNQDELRIVTKARDILGLYKKNEDIINVGAYSMGASAKIDEAIRLRELIMNYLKQPIEELIERDRSFDELRKVLG